MDRRAVERTRLSLFGRMAMGVAHEVDNHLSVVLGFSELIRIPGIGEKKTTEHAGKIHAAGERIGIIIKHFSYYARSREPVREPFNPSGVVREILTFSRYDLGRGGVVLDIPSDLPSGSVVGDRRDFALALLALLFNGAEAMAGTGGILRVEVSLHGSGWSFQVTDEGPGIPADALPRVFEEGFTQKADAVHGGMGLPVAQSLIEDMGGAVSVENRPGGGCIATIRLPGKPEGSAPGGAGI
jgi:two-component system, NtrC family, sensor kinase